MKRNPKRVFGCFFIRLTLLLHTISTPMCPPPHPYIMHIVVQALQAREEMMKQNEVLKEVSITHGFYIRWLLILLRAHMV